MKMNFSYTNIKIFRRNLPLLMGLVSLCLVSLLIVYLNFLQYQSNKLRIEVLKSELDAYSRKKSLLDFKNQVVDREFDLDTANLALTQLIPVKEDYFSILATMEKLSAQTNFIITSYNIIVENSTPDKLAILIEGQGDPDVFLEFLKEYNFSGGRLVTIDKIDFSQESFKGVKVNINVYSGKVDSLQSGVNLDNVDIPLINNMLTKVQIELKPETSVVTDYPTKSNPF